MKYISGLKEGEVTVSFAQVRLRQLRFKKDGAPYLRLVLGDRTGRVEAKIWDSIERFQESFREGDFVKYRGMAQSYNGALQVVVDRIRRLKREDFGAEVQAADLVASTPYDVEEMWKRLRQIVKEQVKRPCVLQLLEGILETRSEQIKTFPAGTEVHHNYWGGFLEHILSVLEGAVFFADKYPGLDKDLLVAGAVVHDIGKLEELSRPENPTYTTRGILIGHIILGRDILLREAEKVPEFPASLLMLLEHVILSHQGQPEWGSPKRPQIPEALVIHYLDDLDAKMNRFRQLLQEEGEESDFTSYDRFLGRSVFKGEYDLPPLKADPADL